MRTHKNNKGNINSNNQAKIDRLLTMAFKSGRGEVVASYARQVLDIDPDNPDALLLTADFTADDNERVEILNHAIRSAKISPVHIPAEREILLLGLYQRLAFTLFSLEKYDEALKLLEEKVLTADPEIRQYLAISNTIKDLYYRILIQIHDWKKILAYSMKDDEQSLARAYSRLLATFILTPEADYSICAKMFWDALILGPDVPFFMLGYFEEPDENESPKILEEFNFAVMFYDILSISDEFFRWFSRGVILFGLLSGRLSEDYEKMLDILNSLGGLQEYEAMNKILIERDDAAIIEMLAAHKCLAR